jgi:hypothetical protein
MPQKQTLFDAISKRRKELVRKLGTDRVRNSPKKLTRIAHELREISKRLETFGDNPQ